jgi:hypothetical protein
MMQAYAYDDAYIHFRVAENFIKYGAPYYNPSDSVMVSSSSGWTLVLSLFALFVHLTEFLDIRAWTAVINGLATGLGALVYLPLLYDNPSRSKKTIISITFVVTYLSQVIKPSLGLMETPLSLLLTGLALRGLRNHKPQSMLLFGVLPFFRPELVILSGIAMVYSLLFHNETWKRFSWIGMGALPFIIFNYAFFGSLIPNTIQAKSVVYDIQYNEELVFFISKIIDDIRLLSSIPGYPFILNFIYVFFILILLSSSMTGYLYNQLSLLIRKAEVKIDIIGTIFGLFGIVLLSGYLVKKVLLFTWYEPLYVIPGLFILCKVLQVIPGNLRIGIAVPLLFTQVIGLVEIILGLIINPALYQDFNETARVRRYLTVGYELYACFPDARLMTSEIGGLGYSFQGQILDGMGLASPQALTYHPLAIPDERSSGMLGAIPVAYIEEEKPEIIVSYNAFIEAFLNSQVLEAYQQHRLPTFNQDDSNRINSEANTFFSELNIFIRKDYLSTNRSSCPALGITP